MAENHDSHFSAPMLTKAHWRKPRNVSSFILETCWMENITRWQTTEGIWQHFQQRLGRLPLQTEIKVANAKPDSSCCLFIEVMSWRKL